jgi:hypothetical protein
MNQDDEDFDASDSPRIMITPARRSWSIFDWIENWAIRTSLEHRRARKMQDEETKLKQETEEERE